MPIDRVRPRIGVGVLEETGAFRLGRREAAEIEAGSSQESSG